MPLHHIGGIVSNIYAPLASGSGAVYIAKFSAALVLNLDALSPKVTWIYCVPSHLQAILAARTPDSKPPSCVRLYRSGAAALPVAVAEELKQWSGATVLPTYSMSECMPIASPSREYDLGRPYSVGPAVGPDLMISEKGEVLIRGPMVSNDNPEEWFATGDLGSLDADGWLTLTGRSKEIINRGGEVVGPLEVEDACLRHPAVAECVCFAVPHEALGEALGLCIVPHSNIVAPSLDELRQFLEPYLTAAKRPQHVWYMTSLIKGPTGKPLRVGLADKLGIAKQGGDTGGGIAASASSVDAVIEAVRRVTGIKASSGAARVSDLGMDSLSLMRLSHALRGLGGSSEVDKLLLADATIDTLAVAVARPAAAAAEKKIDLDPVFGLRSLFCLFVVRAHFARHFAALCDTWWYDIHHAWHTSVFFIISGAQMFMTYSERPVPTCVEINQCVGCGIATPSSRRRKRAVKFDFHTGADEDAPEELFHLDGAPVLFCVEIKILRRVRAESSRAPDAPVDFHTGTILRWPWVRRCRAPGSAPPPTSGRRWWLSTPFPPARPWDPRGTTRANSGTSSSSTT